MAQRREILRDKDGRFWWMGKYRYMCQLCWNETPKEELSATDLCPRCIDILVPIAIDIVKKAKGRFRRPAWREIQDTLYPNWPKRD